ncbi:MAG: hypothetical protein H6721_07290 [Sandaracinus sp.]|nr:hypothetical protein [Sandaracinus sp.]MCB9620067.1 hypothetical protein [Sandaracinus sp.]MCB9631924.1 hypothetical protein [Sandaracinus sp.]
MRAAVLVGVASVLLAVPARAQERDVERARVAYTTATRAAEEARWVDALDGFREAYRFSRIPPALLNVGVSLRALGRYVEARDTFEELARLHPDYASEVDSETFRREVAAAVATVVVRGLPATSEHEVRVDGRVRFTAARGPELRIELDPGTHVVEVRRAGFRTARWEGPLEPGAQASMQVVPLAETPEVLEREVRVEVRPRHRGLWIGLSVGLVLLAGGITGGVVAQRNAQLEPATNNRVRLP